MKKDKIIYWSTTGIVAAMMAFSAFGYFTNPEMKSAFVKFGFPDFFRIELGTAKFLGAIALILPFTPKILKDFAYAGFVIVFVSAFVAHIALGDPIGNAIAPIVFFSILVTSYIYNQKVNP